MHVGCLLGTSACGRDWADWRNTSGQQPSLSLAFCRHIFYVIPGGMVRCARGFSLSLRKFLRATTGRTGQNNSCQQAALSLAFCMHVLSVFNDTMVRRAIGVSLSLRKCLRPTMVIAWDGLAGLHTSACPSSPQVIRKHVLHRFHDVNLRLQQGSFTLSMRQLPCRGPVVRGPWSGLGAPELVNYWGNK